MPLSIGVNLRVTGHCNQGGRKYMEDMFSVAYQQSSNDRELEYAFFGIFDGHGGGEAATFAKENLMDIIVKQKNFWSDNDEDVLKAIRDGYVNTHYAMWRELEKWPRTASGLPSTAGTTASIAFIRKGKIYIGHVGDSAIILGYQEKDDPLWKSRALTRDHKPECGVEMTRIQESGGKVVSKSGVPRVVWNRPRLGHKGPVRRSTHIDEIPFLAVARSLGDLWSYNSELNTFVVSPEPDVKVIKIDVKSYRCLIFGTDGLWNMLTPQAAVAIVQAAEKHNEKHLIASQQTGNEGEAQMWINPSKSLVDRALDRWLSTRLRADNTSVVTLMLDPPGPTHSEILLSQKREQLATARPPIHSTPASPVTNIEPAEPENTAYIHKRYVSPPPLMPYPYPENPAAAAPPSYSEIQKHPDSSDHHTNEAPTVMHPRVESPKSSKHSSPSSKKETNHVESPSKEESIQVAEISSSNASDDQQPSCSTTTGVALDESLNTELDTPIVESSLCEDEDKDTEISASSSNEPCEADLPDAKSMVEKESKLLQVPKAEKFNNDSDNAELQAIKFTEPQGSRFRRSSGGGLAKRMSGSVMTTRQPNSRRRHSTGAPNTSQRQRRSLTPKTSSSTSTTNTPTYLPSGTNRLKRTSKVLMSDSEFNEKTKAGVGTRHSSECRHSDAKDAASGVNVLNSGSSGVVVEPCLKRRTRSEDIKNMQDENSPANQKVEQHNRLRWPGNDRSIAKSNVVLNSDSSMIQERRLSSPNSFKRRNIEKKVTPVKTIRRPSINRSSRGMQMRDLWDQRRASRLSEGCTPTTPAMSRRQTVVNLINSMADSVTMTSAPSPAVPKRWLRSDTIAATPIKTLRSRNVDLQGQTVPAQVAHQYDRCGTNKPIRILDSQSKLKQQAAPGVVPVASPATPQATDVTKLAATPRASTPTIMATPNRTKQSSQVTTPGPATSGTSTGSISKRAKTPYNPSARSLSTRTRIKRFSK